jgi:hypothetical protein
MKRTLLAAILLVSIAVLASGVTISSDKLELIVFDSNGRFSLYAIEDSGKKTALLVDEDPRTTVLTVLAGSKIYRMGDSFEFRQSIESTDDTVNITWSAPIITVKETFKIDGSKLQITLTIENTSEQNIEIGVRYLLDTKLGEKGVHFAADDLPVATETDYVWATPYELVTSDGEDVDLHLMLSGDGITDPDRVVVANWKRLNDSSWTFQSNQDRDFSLLPYSINDSAVALYFEPEQVPSSTVKSLSYVLDWVKTGSTLSTAETTTEQESELSGTGVDAETIDAILSEIVKIDSFLILLDRFINGDEPPTSAEIDSLKERLSQIEKEKEDISEQP